jgi:hypothetical protein
METKSVIGEVHPGDCWSNWDGKVAECKQCSIAERCSESTKRVQNAAPPATVPAAKQKPAPVKAPAPEPAKPVVKTEPAKPAVKAEPAKPVAESPKVESAKPEPALISAEAFVETVREQLGKGATAEVKEGVSLVVCNFRNAEGVGIGRAGFTKDGKNAKLQTSKGERVFKNGYKDADVVEAVKALF